LPAKAVNVVDARPLEPIKKKKPTLKNQKNINQNLPKRMIENQIFTEEFINRYDSIGYNFDKDYRRMITTNPDLEVNRQQLEKAIQNYPESHKIKWIEEFQNPKTSCKALISELRVHNLLVQSSGKDNVEIEPKLDDSDQRPDFYCLKENIAVEVFSILDIISPIEQEIYHIICKLKTNISFRLEKIYGINDKIPPSFKGLKKELNELISSKAELVGEKQFSIQFGNGIAIRGIIYKKNGIREISTQRNYFPSIDEYEKKLRNRVRNRLKGKLRKYNKLRHKNIKIVIVIYDWISHVFTSKKEWQQIFNGVETRKDLETNRDTSSAMVWNQNKNRGLSMVLVSSKTKPLGYFHHFENKFSNNKLTKEEIEKLTVNFKK